MLTLPRTSVALAAALLLTACGEPPAPSTERARPVEVRALAVQNPAAVEALPGLVTAYRRTQLAFEVSGRLSQVPAVGETVRGPVYTADGEVIRPGDVVARVESSRYERQLAVARARETALSASAEALRIRREKVLPRDRDAAVSRLARTKLEVGSVAEDLTAARTAARIAREDFQRVQGLREAGAASQAELEQAEGAVSEADARVARLRNGSAEQVKLVEEAEAAVEQAESSLELADADLAAALAQLEEARLATEQATQDLADCVLRAPFSGEVVAVTLADGSAVRGGEPVVELALLEPVRVEIAVSRETRRRLTKRTQVEFLLANEDLPDAQRRVIGVVYERGVGDPETGTFHIGIVAANPLIETRPVSPADADVARAYDVFPAFTHGDDDGLHVHEDCLSREDGKVFVYRLPGVDRGKANDAVGVRMQPEVLEVQLANRFEPISEFRLQQLVDDGTLFPGDVLIRNPRPEQRNGVILTDLQRALQPGDVVSVLVEDAGRRPGFYVPVTAISELNGDTSVFVVEDGRAVRRVISVHDSWNDRRRIEGEGVAPGVQVVVVGAHFLAEGDEVQIVGGDDGAAR